MAFSLFKKTSTEGKPSNAVMDRAATAFDPDFKKGDPVKIDGTLVGHVVRIEPDGLTITLDKPIRLPLREAHRNT